MEAADKAGIYIPTLCHLKGFKPIGACRVCVVEIEGARSLQASCSFSASEMMVVKTNSKRVLDARKTIVELLLSAHRQECAFCNRNLNCELQEISKRVGVEENHFEGSKPEEFVDTSSPSIVRD